MPDNVFPGNNGIVALQNITFDAAGITSDNTTIIWKIGNPYRSFMPTRGINPISSFVSGERYIAVMKQAKDFTAFAAPPFPAGTGSGTTIISLNY